MRLYVETWDPAYGAAMESADFGTGPSGAGPTAESDAKLDTEVELPAAAWRPLDPPTDVRAPDLVLLVDGVRRVDARVWIGADEASEADAAALPGLVASYAAGVVRCDLRRGAAEVVAARVARGLFTPSTAATEVVTRAARYPAYRAGGGEPKHLLRALQEQLQSLERLVAAECRDESSADELLVVDGPLSGRSRALGYIKSQERAYLPGALSTVISSLRPGQRSPVFLLGSRWRQYSWYLRLPGPTSGGPWAGIVRLECSAELTAGAAAAMADLSMITLPRLASHTYKDPRAPQNLVPVAGLERRLRAMLGDSRLLHRALTSAAREPALR
jgi:uncharacterized protein